MRKPCFSSPEAERCFDELALCAQGFNTIAVYEAAAVLMAQAIASGSFNVENAQATIQQTATALAADVASNWPVVMAQRQRARQ